MKKTIYFLLALLFTIQNNVLAQEEKLLYSTDFQDWVSLSAGAEQTVIKRTDFSNEILTFKFLRVNVAPAGIDAGRFVYSPNTPSGGGVVVTPGWAVADKITDSSPQYIELLPLSSITKVSYTHGATGNNRGYGLMKKSAATGGTWVSVYSGAASPAAGQTVEVSINDVNVSLRFVNLAPAQNAYLFDLKIKGNYTFINPQVLTTSVNVLNSGTIVRLPESDKYEQDMQVSLKANANPGYEFEKWVDVSNGDAQLSTSNPYAVTMNAAKNIKAVFKSVTLQNFALNVVGSNWGKVQLSPEPVNGKYPLGTEVVMTVIPNRVSTFSYWEDNSTATQRTVIINSDVNYTATFDEIPFIVGWDFKNQDIKQNKAADFYSESINTGNISVYEPSGTTVNWLSNAGSFSPSYPNIRLWTTGTNFKTQRRYVQAQFSTIGYKSVQVKSMVSANYQAYSIMTLQYSLDGTNFTPVGSANITSVHNSGWTDLNVTLPKEAEGKTLIYVRWIADESSTIINEGNDNDGAALTNVYVFADKELINDTDAPVLVSTVPLNSSSTATINGSIVLTFNEKVKLGSGNITLNGKSLTGVFGSKTATFLYEKLDYNTEYTFVVPQGALTDMSGNIFVGTSIVFKTGMRSEPTKKLFDKVVAKDGTGDYTSVIDAIAAAPANLTSPWLIFIKNGKYTGHHDIPATKPFIHLIGQSRDGVIISDNRLSGTKNPDDGTPVYHVSLGATMVVNSKNCYFENITLENSFGYENQTGPQALALYSITDKFTMNNCYLRSYQDTYLTAYSSIADRHYIKNTRIEGAVDFIYGGGDVFFDRDTITVTRKDGGYIVAPSHGVGTAWGYVFSNCIINESKVTGATTYFGRPWQNAPKTVFINTTLKTGIYAKGWYYKMGAIPPVFADYGTMDANGNPVDLSQRISDYEYDIKDGAGTVTNIIKGVAKNKLTDEEAGTYTYENVILRAGDSWDPRIMTEAPQQPSNIKITNKTLTWDATSYTRLYIVTKNNEVIGFTINNQFVDNSSNLGNDIYKIQSVSEYGALSVYSQNLAVLPLDVLTFTAKKKQSINHNTVVLNWETAQEKATSHFEIQRSGADLNFVKIDTKQTLNIAGKNNYSYEDVNPLTGVNYYRLVIVDQDGTINYSKTVSVDISQFSFEIYPNPTSDYINIMTEDTDASITIFNISGKKILSLKTVNNRDKISLAAFSEGTYIVVYKSKGKEELRKIVKK